MIKNIIFDFGNIIVKFVYDEMVSYYTNDDEVKKFLIENVIYSKEWLEEGLLDKGEVTLEEMANRINERTNYIHEKEVTNMCTDFPNKLKYNGDIINLIKKLREKGYNLYVLSNTSKQVFDLFYPDLNPLFDGMVLSYKIGKIKPFKPIYEYLINKYDLDPYESIFIDDREDNIKTANSFGIKGRKINPDDYEDIVKVLNEYSLL